MKGILKDAAILFVITLVAGLCLGAVHEVTLDPIAKAQEAATTKTYKEVFPEAAKFEQTDELTAAVAASADEILAQGFGNVSVDDAQVAEAEDGSVLGYLITASSTEGYNGLVQISVGITSEKSDWSWFLKHQRDSWSWYEGKRTRFQGSVQWNESTETGSNKDRRNS